MQLFSVLLGFFLSVALKSAISFCFSASVIGIISYIFTKAESLESFKNEDGQSYWEERFSNNDVAPDIQTILKENYKNYKMTLSPFESQVYSLYLTDKNIYDIALQLNACPVSVRNALSRCRNKLKKIIS